MLFELILHVGVALFAAFGVCCALKMLAESLFYSDQIAVAIEVRTEDDAQALAMLLREARVAFWRRGGTRLLVLMSAELMDGRMGVGEDLNEECLALLERYDAECYLIDME